MNLSAAASFFLIVLFCEEVQSKSQWNVNCKSKNICALKGSTVKMNCEYSHPNLEYGKPVKVTQTFWFTKIDKEPVDLTTQEEYANRAENNCLYYKKNCTLTIRDVKKTDSAEYKFRFITDSPGGSYTGPGVHLSVRDSDADLTVKKKSSSWSSALECSSSCFLPDDSTYVWYKNGEDMNTRTRDYNKWVGDYDSMSCALKGHEDFPSPLACFQSDRCNKVTYSHGRICATKGSSVKFHSNYISYYSNYVTSFWFNAGRSAQPEDINYDSKYLGRVHVTDTRRQSTLTISKVMANDSGEYRFIFRTDWFRWGSDLHGITLTVTDLQVEVTSTSINQGLQYAELKCHSRCTPAGYYNYTWFRNGQDIHHRESTYKVLVNTTDKISCALSSFNEQKAPEVYAPVLTSVSAGSSDDTVEGNPVFLKCSSDANPPANYTWHKKTKTSALQLHGKDSEFHLSPIQTSDSGEYFCVANNQLGISRSGYLNIEVKYAPKRADVSLSHGEIVEGDSVNLTCSSDGNPAPSYRWYKDNQAMLQGQGGGYQFPSVKSEDSGTYRCEVGNVYGWINSSTVLINVEYSPRLPSVSMNPPGDAAAGSSVSLTCSSAANPAATYTWYKEHSTSPAAEGQTFTIVDISGEHGGNYYCQARNSRGHHNSTLHLIVVSSSASSAVAGSITFLILIGLFLSVFIIFRKKKAVRQIRQTREGPGDYEMKRLGNLGRHPEGSSTAGLRNSANQDDVCYASVLFSKNQEEPLYSNFVPAEPKTSQKEENVEYSAIMIKNTPCKKSYDASEESSALYSTVCKVNRL